MGNNMPCKGCTKRTPGCHDRCDDYKQEVSKLKALKDKKAKATRAAWEAKTLNHNAIHNLRPKDRR